MMNVARVRHDRFAQLAMPSVAAATPPGHELRLVDEKVEPIDEDLAADVVGITLYTTVAPHGYALARRFRERGAFVVLGGPHPSALPEEALRHADAVVVGDAEDTWPQLLADLAAGRPQRLYRSSSPPLDDLRPARLDLLAGKSYPTHAVTHATRGCPHRCEFCSVPGLGGLRYRKREVRAVVEEVERLEGPLVVFWDDNLVADRAYARELFRELRPLWRRWIGQATLSFARDRELVRAAAAAGCIGLFVGVESFSSASLASVRKGMNRVEEYGAAIGALHDAGIAVDAGIIFGFDHDGPEVFDATLEAAQRIRLDVVNFNVLTPFPGTPLFDRFEREGRLLTKNWELYEPNLHVVFQPARMTPSELQAGHRDAMRAFYRRRALFPRVLRSPPRAWGLSWSLNWHFRRVTQSIASLPPTRLALGRERPDAEAGAGPLQGS
jgi:radical SAM superfamily enzyme YgiQ (UPF0313 family)